MKSATGKKIVLLFTLWASLSATTQHGGKADDTESSALPKRLR
jgi:hypothetical protein